MRTVYPYTLSWNPISLIKYPTEYCPIPALSFVSFEIHQVVFWDIAIVVNTIGIQILVIPTYIRENHCLNSNSVANVFQLNCFRRFWQNISIHINKCVAQEKQKNLTMLKIDTISIFYKEMLFQECLWSEKLENTSLDSGTIQG